MEEATKSLTRDTFLSAYRRLGNLRQACEETGCAPYIGYRWAKIGGALTTNDGQQYGTSASRAGAAAEAEFHKLVPEALCANRNLEVNCPGFDFDVRGIRVDVKFSTIRQNGTWGFKTGVRKPLPPDFYACFFATNASGKCSDGYRLLLIPHDLLNSRTQMSLRADDPLSDWWKFEVQPARLAEVFKDMEE